MLVLIIDDSKAMRMVLMSHLRKAGFGGHTYIEADNGLNGLAVIKEKNPNVVLCDWNMPEMTGIELLSELNRLVAEKTLDALPNFVFVTSESTTQMKTQAEELGAKAFITKPFSVEIFEAKLANIL